MTAQFNLIHQNQKDLLLGNLPGLYLYNSHVSSKLLNGLLVMVIILIISIIL